MRQRLVLNATHRELRPVDYPAKAELSSALEVISQQELAVYQRLYREGLTSPGPYGKPFSVQRSQAHSGCIEVSATWIDNDPSENAEVKFLVLPDATDLGKDVLKKACLLFRAINEGRKRIHILACCLVATFRPCVCLVSFSCEIHGETCHGSHD